MIKFKIVDHFKECVENSTVYLILDDWNDWFTYQTLYNVHYVDKDGIRKKLYGVKIGQKNQGRTPQLPKEFTQLGEDYFSLGGSENYYEALNNISPKGNLRIKILKALNDIAYDLELFEKVKNYDVTTVSLLRDKTENMIKNQYNRMTEGGAWLTDYKFNYTFKNINENDEDEVKLDFEVVPEVIPPTNIHVLIGKNGVGKTTLLRNMLLVLENNEEHVQYGKVDIQFKKNFANIVYMSFSAFDARIEIEDEKIPYLNIGLLSKNGIMNQEDMCLSFSESLFEITQGTKKKLWEKSLTILESDNTFAELNIKGWSGANYGERDKDIIELMKSNSRLEDENKASYIKRIFKIKFVEETMPKFKMLSSGHKVILLTISKLIDYVEEKTLVLLDEPEEHLHPPLVSAFIRTLSELLVYRNGVGIIATHSPVIVQEVPKNCVWILRRVLDKLIAERPNIETFGENLGVLTSEIFGYEVTNSGFHKMIYDAINRSSTYKSALRYFDENLGNEGKIILRSLMFEKEQSEGGSYD